MNLVVEFKNEDIGRSVVFDSNDRGSYAYLLQMENRNILSDVWLYNILTTPKNHEWTNSNCQPPFMNPEEFALASEIRPVLKADDLHVEWITNEIAGFDKAILFIRNEQFAILTDEDKPGYSKFAKIDGPLAKVFNPNV